MILPKASVLVEARGALVGDVFKDGPAMKADIQSGDIVLSFDGKDVDHDA